ncbi:unnamed protein product, partial [Larinioides sclopetarius]
IEFVTNCKRVLGNAIKNRNAQQNLIDFELMKLVRYQDSRIVQICKDQLVFLQKSANVEALAIKEKIKKLDRTGLKQELFDMCKKDLQEFIQMVNGTIQLTESILQSIIEKKMKIEMEDAQFVAVCRNLFLSQIMQRKKELSLFKQIADQITEINLTVENMQEEAYCIFKVIYGIPEHARRIRQQEKEKLECELIKKMDIKVSDAVADCEQFFMEMSETLKNDVLEFKKELDNISAKKEYISNLNEEEFSALVTRYSNYILSIIEKNVDDGKELKKKVDSLQGKSDVLKIEEINMDALNVSDKESSQKKLKTEASDMLSLCMEVLYYIIENFKIGIKEIKIALEELQTFKEPIVKKTVKPLSETLPTNHNYSAKQLALLDELEQEILNSETGKEELEYCEHLYITTIDRKEDKIQIFKQILEKLSTVEVDLSSKIAYTYLKSKEILQECVELLESELNHSLESFESLKKYSTVSEENPDITKLSDVERIVERCKHLMQMSIKLRREAIHALNLQLKFFVGQSQESRQRKPSILPSWQERFLTFMNMKKDDFDAKKRVFPSENPAVNDLGQENISLKLGQDLTESSTNMKVMMYKNLLLSIEHKRQKQPSYCVSAWNDILVQAFLLQQLKDLEGLNIKDFTEAESTESGMGHSAFRLEQTWDELLRHVIDIAKEQSEVASKLQAVKQTFVPLYPWHYILSKATDSWNEQICKQTSAKKQENTLLQWKSRMSPKEYSEYVAGYQYRAVDDRKETQIPDDSIENFTVDLKALATVFDRDTIHEDTPVQHKQKSFVSNSWESIFEDAYMVIKEGNQLVDKLKEQDMSIQYQAARLHSPWSEYFFKAVEARKEELNKELKENDLLQSVAHRIREKMQSGVQEQIFDNMTFVSESWTETISEMFQSYQEELAEAVNIKKREMSQPSAFGKPVKFEERIEDHPFLKIETEELIKQGKCMFMLALDIRNAETASMQNQLQSLKPPETKIDENFVEVHGSFDIWKKIVSSALDFNKKGLSLHQQRRKDQQKHLVPWETIFQNAYSLLTQDLEKAEKLGLKEKQPEEDSDMEYIDDNSEYFSNWADVFLDAAEQEIKEMNPNQIDLHEIFEKNLSSEILPSWNEILYVFSNYNTDEIKEIIFSKNWRTLADQKELSNLKLMVSHHNFNWDHIILATIEEFLKIIEKKTAETLVEDSESKGNFVLALLQNKFQKMDQSNKEKESEKREHFGACEWFDLLPTEETGKKFQVEEELLETKIMLENPTSCFKEERIPDDLIWKRIFPFAVLAWRKNLGDYLKFSKMSSMEKLVGTTYSRADEIKLLKAKLYQERKRMKKFTDDISLKSKKIIKERFDIKNSNSIPECGSNGNMSVPDVSHNLLIRKKIESYEPQYFSVTATWREVFFAAVERNRKILYKLFEFKKFNATKGYDASDTRFHESGSESLKSQKAGQEELKELFSAQNVLNLPVTLRELFDTTAVLQQKKLVLFNQPVDEDRYKISETKQKGSFKAFDVINNFKHIFTRGLYMRKKEMDMVEEELEKRDKDEKDIFRGYVDLSENQSLRLRNKKHIRILRREYQNIQFIRTDFERKLISHLDRCARNFESTVDKRNDQKFQVDLKAMDTLLECLNLKEQELLSAAKRVLMSISELRKTEIKHLETEAKNLRKRESFDNTLENKITELLSETIPFLSNGLSERKDLQNLLLQAIDFIEDAERNVYTKVRSASVISKQFLINAIRNKKSEIETMEKEVHNLKCKVDCNKKKVAKIITACENYIQKISEKRKSEIQLLETYLNEMSNIQVAEFHSRCMQYFSNAIEKRKQEIIDVEVLTEPLKEKDEELDSEMSSAIDEALCEAFGIDQGMTFFKIQEEKRETQVAKLDPE